MRPAPDPCRRPLGTVALLLAAVVAVMSVAVPPVAAAADDDLRWTVVPSSPTGPKGRLQFDYELSPREAITDWVSVSNVGRKPLRLSLYATDAFTAADGGFALLLKDQPAEDVGTWIKLPMRELTLPVGKRADIPWRLTVPANAKAGDHIGGLIASVTEQQVNQSGQRVEVERRVAARVYLRVPGQLTPGARITTVNASYDGGLGPAGGPVTVTYRIANTGNVRLSGKARVQLTGPAGIRLANSEVIDVPELLPDSEIRVTRRFDSILPAGRINALVVFNPRTTTGELPGTSRSAGVWAMPWLGLGLLAMLVGLIGWRLLRRRAWTRLERADGRQPEAASGQAVPAGGR